MQRLINTENLKPGSEKNHVQVPTAEIGDSPSVTETDVKLTLEILIRTNPGKLLFSPKEAASYCGVGVEFIRRRIKNNKINATNFGDKPMVHIAELARIITEGVNGN